MTSRDVTDEQLGHLSRKQHDLFRRVREGTIPIDVALKGLQALIEGGTSSRPQQVSSGLDHYRIKISYTKLPDIASLEGMFSGKHSVSPYFDGRAWISRRNIDETPGEREFLVAKYPGEKLVVRRYGSDCDASIGESEDTLEERFAVLGYRFASVTEAIEFAQFQPQLQRKNRIFALGSSVIGRKGLRFVIALDARNRARERTLRTVRIHDYFHHDDRFLLVRL